MFGSKKCQCKFLVQLCASKKCQCKFLVQVSEAAIWVTLILLLFVSTPKGKRLASQVCGLTSFLPRARVHTARDCISQTSTCAFKPEPPPPIIYGPRLKPNLGQKPSISTWIPKMLFITLFHRILLLDVDNSPKVDDVAMLKSRVKSRTCFLCQ
jgi:hypothetical protein